MAAYEIVKVNLSKLSTQQQKASCVRLIMRCVKFSNADHNWRRFYSLSNNMMEFLLSLSKELESQFITLILQIPGAWSDLCKFFGDSKAKLLVADIQEKVDAGSALPKEISSLLLKYFEAKYEHKEECYTLLTLLQPGSTFYHQAVKKVIKNSQFYTAQALLMIAKLEHERSGGSRDRREIFTVPAFDLIKLAFEKFKSKPEGSLDNYDDASTSVYLSWLFGCFPEKQADSVSKGTQFSHFLQCIHENFANDPEIVVKFLDTIKSHKALLQQGKQKLGDKLISSYKDYFQRVFHNCSHTSYGRVLREMNKARQSCKLYTHNGESMFDSVVVKHIKQNHRGKKKLLRMMDDEFSNDQPSAAPTT